MVFPENTKKEVIDGKEVITFLPRKRLYPSFANNNVFIIFVQAKIGGSLKIRNFAKTIYSKFPLVNEIQFVNNSKLKILTDSLKTANDIISDENFRSIYNINVPFDLCEVKGVAALPLEYSEEELFNYVGIKHKPEFGIIEHIDHISILEVRRLSTRSSNDPKIRVELNKAVLTFSGTVLPSHVKMDGILTLLKATLNQFYNVISVSVLNTLLRHVIRLNYFVDDVLRIIIPHPMNLATLLSSA